MIIIVSILIVLVILAIVFGLFYFRKQNNDLIDQITARLDQFRQNNIDEMIDQISDTKLSGETLADFTQDKEKYVAITKEQLPKMESQLIDYSEKNLNFQVWSAHHALKQLAQQSLNQQEVLEHLRNTFSNLFDHIQKNQTALEHIEAKSQKLQNKLQTNMVHYQEAYAPLQNQLDEITKRLPTIKELVATGDALKAHKLLEETQVQLSKFQTESEQVLQRSTGLETDFKAELKELVSAEQKLNVAGINMEDPQIDVELTEIKQQIKQLKDLLALLQINQFDQLKVTINERIDYLYERIAQEWRAQKKVQNAQLVLADFIQHAQRQNRLLLQNINRLGQHYIIKQEDQDVAISCQQKIQQISQNYQNLVKSIKQRQAIYSKVWQEFQQASQQLTEIEHQQQKIAASFDGLRQGENVGQDNLQQISQQLRQLKHQIEVMRLPGLPPKYQDNYQMVHDEVDKLAELLADKPVNVEEVTKQMFVTQEDLNNLKQQTKKLWDDVQIASRLLQYSNRYVEEYPAVKQAANKSQNLYDQKFNYQQAREVISQALEQVEPGAVKRISELYYAESESQK